MGRRVPYQPAGELGSCNAVTKPDNKPGQEIASE